MKKLIYIFFFLFSFFFLLSSSFSQTNIYHPFPDSNAVWYVFSSNSQGWTNYSNYSIIGDTVIENKTYHKLYSNSIYYTGAYRNVDSLQKVYFVPYNDTTETVFYDFDVNIGDTIDFYPSILCCGLKPIVYNIDTIYIKSIPRKRITVSSCSFLNHYIEGIGCTGDLVSGEFCFEGEASLECFF